MVDEIINSFRCSDLSVVVLLAGRSRRMGHPKQHVKIGGLSFLEHVLRALNEIKNRLARPWLFVGGADDDLGKKQVTGAGGIWLVNLKPEEGPISSIWIALDCLPEGHGFLMWPIDHPLVQRDTLIAILDAATMNPHALVVPSFRQRRGHPVVFPPWAVAELRKAPLDEGARWVFKQYPQKIIHVEVDDPWVLSNINTPEILNEAESWLMKRQPKS